MTIRQMSYAQSAYRNLAVNNQAVNKSLNKLSSGYRINSAADDAAGLSVSAKMRGQISGLNMATQNATNAISLVQTAEGGMQNTSDILNRMRELAVQASNGTYSDDERAILNQEFQQLKGEIGRVSGATNYNGKTLLDGTFGGTKGSAGLSELGVSGVSAGGSLEGAAKFTISTEDDGTVSVTARIGDKLVKNQLQAGDTSTTFDFGGGNTITMDFANGTEGLKDGTISNVGFTAGSAAASYANAVSVSADSAESFQIGANGGADQRMSIHIGDMSSSGIGIADLDISSLDGANSAISALDKAVNKVSGERANLGAAQNRLTHTINSLQVSNENLVASESSIRDLDMAEELMSFTQRKLMLQASQAMMAQGMNLSRSNMLGLLMR